MASKVGKKLQAQQKEELLKGNTPKMGQAPGGAGQDGHGRQTNRDIRFPAGMWEASFPKEGAGGHLHEEAGLASPISAVPPPTVMPPWDFAFHQG